jgi:hypothetical protein
VLCELCDPAQSASHVQGLLRLHVVRIITS